MTAGELIDLVDLLRPNQYSSAQKLRWLRRLDGQILAELEATHEPAREAAAGGELSFEIRESSGQEGGEAAALPDAYTAETELLAPFPYDEELYTAYLFCQIDLHNAEIQKYNQSLSLLAAAWRSLADWINRGAMPKGAGAWKM